MGGSVARVLICLFIAASSLFADAAKAPPSLFIRKSGSEDGSVDGARIPSVDELPKDLDIILSGGRPNAAVVEVDRPLLESGQGPRRLNLVLPLGLGQTITVTRRLDVEERIAAAAAISEGVTADAAPIGGTNATRATSTGAILWVGEVVGAPGPLSAVTLVDHGNNLVTGDIRYWDRRAKRFRSFRIAPLILGAIDPVVAAAAARPEDVSGLYPELDPNNVAILEYREPKQQHKFRVGTPRAPLPSVVDTTPPGGRPVITQDPSLLPGLNALDYPAPTDPAELAAVMVASAGPAPATDEQEQLSADEAEANPAVTPADGVTADAGAGVGRKLLQTAITSQDLLVVFTPAAATRAGGVETVKSQIRSAVAKTNKAYTDSQVPVVLNLLDIRQVDYNETGRDPLVDIRDGLVPNVTLWRNEMGADLVSIFNDNTGECGVAWMPVAPAQAFSAVMRGCFDAGYSLAHEIGHNQGCGHNADPRVSSKDLWAPYAWGWRRCDLGNNGNFKTIMSYHCPNLWVTPIAAFSNPRLTYQGVPTGNTTMGDCARAITESAATVAAHSATRLVPPPATSRAITSRMHDGNMCVDAPSWSSGTQLTIFGCHGGPNQQFEHLANAVRFAIRSQCMDVQAEGTRVLLWDCAGSNSQRWFMDRWWRLHPWHAADKCLDVANDRGLQISPCNTSSASQQFLAPFMSRGSLLGSNMLIRSNFNGLLMEVFAFNYSNGAPVVMATETGRANQRWQSDELGQLRSIHNTAFCLTASNAENGAAVFIFDCGAAGLAQRWFRDGNGRFRPYHAVSKVLDIVAGSTAPNARLQLWDVVDTAQQSWRTG